MSAAVAIAALFVVGLGALLSAGCPPSPAAEIPPANLLQVPSSFESPATNNQATLDSSVRNVFDAGSEISKTSETTAKDDGGLQPSSTDASIPLADGGPTGDASLAPSN